MENDFVELVKRASPDLSHLRTTYVLLHTIGGIVGLPILIATFLFAEHVHREPALINFCITWAINSVAYSLLVYSGKADSPPRALCFAQSALIHGTIPMCGTSTLLLVVEIWWTVRDPSQRGWVFWRKLRRVISIILPYVVLAVFVVITVMIQLRNPDGVAAANGLYCSLTFGRFRRLGVPVYSLVMASLMVFFEVSICLRYYRLRKYINESFPMAPRHDFNSRSLSIIVRIALFNLYLFVTFVATIFFLKSKFVAWPYMVQAGLGLVAFILFSSQKSIIRTWCFWRRNPKHTPATLSDESSPRNLVPKGSRANDIEIGSLHSQHEEVSHITTQDS